MEMARLHSPEAKKGPVYDIRKKRANLLPVYHKLRKVDTTYTVNFGGGGSGKSWSTAQSEAKNLFIRKEKLLVIRKFATSLDDSVISQFVEEALPFWGMKEGRDFKYNKTKRTIKTANGSIVMFRGLDNPEKFKSIQGITRVWIEEATEISEKDFTILDDRIRGSEPKILLTYNPISEQHWLKKRFHHPEFPYEKGAEDNVTVIFSTYKENPFVGDKYRRSMAFYKKNNPDHYRVYGEGKFGIIRPENPYFTAYKPTNILGECEFDPTYPIIFISADFNVKNTFLLSQHFEGERINYFEEIHGGDDLEGLCMQLAVRFKHYRIMFTGDASGNNASAYSTGNMSAWQLIEMYFLKYGAEFLDFSQVKTANPSTSSSRQVCNALLAHYGKRIQVNTRNCPILVDDLQRMMALTDGSLNKTDCNKHNYGHLGDALRYDLCHFEYSTFENLGLTPK